MPAYPYLTAEDYASVRRQVDPALTAEDLPPSVIEDVMHLGHAARTIRARVPDADTLTGIDEQVVISAAILLTAAAILRTREIGVASERFADYAVTYDRDARQSRAVDMERRALALLAGLSGSPTLTGLRLTGRRRR